MNDNARQSPALAQVWEDKFFDEQGNNFQDKQSINQSEIVVHTFKARFAQAKEDHSLIYLNILLLKPAAYNINDLLSAIGMIKAQTFSFVNKKKLEPMLSLYEEELEYTRGEPEAAQSNLFDRESRVTRHNLVGRPGSSSES